MSAAKMVLMGVVGAGAGAFLALSTIPSFAPYRDRPDSRPYSGEADGGRAYAQAHAAREQGDAEPEQGLAVRLGAERGTLVLDLPSWAGDTVEWMGFGRRVWDDWRQFAGRFEDAPQEYLREERRDGWQGPPAGFIERNLERQEGGNGYADGYQDERSYDAVQSYAPAERASPQTDAAELAARRAVEAARDVWAAQDQ
jgi:hypothetical protein